MKQNYNLLIGVAGLVGLVLIIAIIGYMVWASMRKPR